MQRTQPSLWCALILAIAATGCSSQPNAGALGADTIGADTSSVAADTAAGDVTDPAAAAADTVLTYHLAPSRTRRDSTSMRAAVRAGMRAMGTWPRGPQLLPGAILPARRIVAFYGNPRERRMGILGAIPPDEMLARLDQEVARWNQADPSTPVQPALHLVSIVAQGAPGRDGKYRLRMDSTLIEQVYDWAQRRNALLFLDIQTGHSTVQEEFPTLVRFLRRPNVHLGVDPEFNMHRARAGAVPGTKIGTVDAEDVNYLIRSLAELVQQHNLPPKILVVHRFTQGMLTNYNQIRLDPRVQVVSHMDGWGPPWLKFDSYHHYQVREPVQFTGFKIFYNHDTRRGDALLTPREILSLRPAPVYIQYQ